MLRPLWFTLIPTFALLPIRAETITVRSGNGAVGTTDSSVHILLGPSTGSFGRIFTAADFSGAQIGPPAWIVTASSLWVGGLAADPSARWIGTTPNAGFGTGSTALYAVSFQVNRSFSAAKLNLSFASDDGVGDDNNPGIYINGISTCTKNIVGFNPAHTVACDLGTPVLRLGTNWLYIEAGNVASNGLSADPAGLIFSATITTTESQPINPTGIVLTIPGTTMPWLYSTSQGGLNFAYQYGLNDGANPSVVSAAQGLNFTPGGTVTVSYLNSTVSLGPELQIPYTDANGQVGVTGRPTAPFLPSHFMNPGVFVGELVGTFADTSGSIAGGPFVLGNGPTTLTIPAGAAQLQLGVNDDAFSDNVGSWSVRITATPPTTQPNVTAVVNAASLQSGPVSPGEVVTISGTNIGPSSPSFLALDQNGNVSTSIGGVQAFFGGTAAPLTYVSATQINAVVPYGVIGLINPSVQISFLGQISNTFLLQSAPTVPALFTLNASGTGPGAILNEDGNINSPANPAPKGSYIVLYATGEGQTAPPGVTGRITSVSATLPLTPQPLLPVGVTIGGQSATVAFYGEAPGLVSGVLQINVRIPASAPSGNLPVQVSVGGIASQLGVTVSVR